MAIFVEVAAFEIAREAAMARQPHIVARAFKIVRMDEGRAAEPGQLFGREPQNSARTRAGPEHVAVPIDHEDEIKRGIEDALIDRADDLTLTLAVEQILRHRTAGSLQPEQDDVSAGMRISANVDPGREYLRIFGESELPAGLLGVVVGGE